MEEVGIGLGSNLGDKAQLLRNALQMIVSKHFGCIRVSQVVETEAWGFTSGNTFYNLVLVAETSLNPDALLDELLSIEHALGRSRKGAGYSDRTIDLDILFYGTKSTRNDKLVIPHPRLHMRRFVLEPLQEILPFWIHPESGKNVSELLDACIDSPLLRKVIL
jgi:2-amino-4-hydroxy-6-hydroxymethyldihydropteridine diphosphokinase